MNGERATVGRISAGTLIDILDDEHAHAVMARGRRAGRCVKFVYGGCQGNQNRFRCARASVEGRPGLSWLAQNQAEDGSWPGRSVNADTAQVDGFMTDAATAYASLALTTCAPALAASR